MYKEEEGYLELLDNIMTYGTDRGDRTGTGTRSIFHANIQFDFSESFPILTTKKVFWNGVMGELLWFLSGKSDLSSLRKFTHGKDKGQKTIWDIDFARWHRTGDRSVPEDEGGNLYGKQWRDFTSHSEGESIHADQVRSVLEEARRNPESRRLLVNAWNAADIEHERLSLPPCHFCYQLYIENGKLNLKWSQRSVDSFLGLPFNIASYAMLTQIYAHWLGYEPGLVIGDLTNVHVYKTHFDAVNEQLKRQPLDYAIGPDMPTGFTLDTIDQFTALDFPLKKYESHPPIKAPMSG